MAVRPSGTVLEFKQIRATATPELVPSNFRDRVSNSLDFAECIPEPQLPQH
jgi:hypothetical protein